MDFLSFTWIDWVIAVVIITSLLYGCLRGFVRESLSLAVWILAALFAMIYSYQGSHLLAPYIKQEVLQVGIAFFVIFFISLIIGTLITAVIGKIVQHAKLSTVDRLLGGVFGILRGGLIIGMLALIGGMSHLAEDVAWQQSLLLPSFSPVKTWLSNFMPAIVEVSLD